MEKKNVIRIFLVTACILLIPLVAMQFTNGASWSLFDFIVAFVLIAGSGLLYEFVAKKINQISYRFAVGIAVVTGFLLMWGNLAVGFIGDEENPANLFYFGVLAVGIIGAFVSGLKPIGMMWTLILMAIAQFLVPLIAMFIWKPNIDLGFYRVLGFNFVFVVLWFISALLFKKSNELTKNDSQQ